MLLRHSSRQPITGSTLDGMRMEGLLGSTDEDTAGDPPSSTRSTPLGALGCRVHSAQLGAPGHVQATFVPSMTPFLHSWIGVHWRSLVAVYSRVSHSVVALQDLMAWHFVPPPIALNVNRGQGEQVRSVEAVGTADCSVPGWQSLMLLHGSVLPATPKFTPA